MLVKKNKILAWLIVFCLYFNFMTIYIFATDTIKFPDISEKDYYYTSVVSMTNKGFIQGFPDGTFKPTNSVTKDEALVLLARISGIDIENKNPHSWNRDILNRMISINAIGVKENTTEKATRLDVAKYITAIYKLDLNKAPKEKIFVDTNNIIANLMYYYNIFVGSNSVEGLRFNEYSYITRADLCMVLNRLNQLIESPYIGTVKYDNYEVSKNPLEIEDLLKIFAYIGEKKVLSFSIPYSINISNSTNLVLLQKNMKVAFNIAFSKYPEYYSFTPVMNLIYNPYSANSGTVTLVFSNTEFTNTELKTMRNMFDTTCNNIIQSLYKSNDLNDTMTDIEKAKILFEYVAVNSKYDTAFTSAGYTGYGAVVNKIAVCQGYTAMYNKLCSLVGLEVEGVSGKIKSNDVEHMWTKIKLNDEWTYCDTTFSDPVPNQENYCDFSYFNMSYNDIMKDRIVDEFLIY